MSVLMTQFRNIIAARKILTYYRGTIAPKRRTNVQTAISELKIEPYFDLEDFMNFSKETRLDSATLKFLIEIWEQWSKILKAVNITEKNKSWAAIWLPDTVENTVSRAWDSDPGQGLLLNSLGQYLCMAAVRELLPQTEITGCAPTPEPHDALRESLAQLGLASTEGILNNRFAIVTHYPFKGGCEVCALASSCPKQPVSESLPDIILPGFER